MLSCSNGTNKSFAVHLWIMRCCSFETVHANQYFWFCFSAFHSDFLNVKCLWIIILSSKVGPLLSEIATCPFSLSSFAFPPCLFWSFMVYSFIFNAHWVLSDCAFSNSCILGISVSPSLSLTLHSFANDYIYNSLVIANLKEEHGKAYEFTAVSSIY